MKPGITVSAVGGIEHYYFKWKPRCRGGERCLIRNGACMACNGLAVTSPGTEIL
jgi:hypothetical protein